MINGISPSQVLIIQSDQKEINLETYQNFEEIVNMTVTAVDADEERIKATFIKFSLNNHPYFGVEGIPVKTLEPNTEKSILDRGYVFADFYPDTPVATARNRKATFRIEAPEEAFKMLIITLFYKGKDDN